MKHFWSKDVSYLFIIELNHQNVVLCHCVQKSTGSAKNKNYPCIMGKMIKKKALSTSFAGVAGNRGMTEEEKVVAQGPLSFFNPPRVPPP